MQVHHFWFRYPPNFFKLQLTFQLMWLLNQVPDCPAILSVFEVTFLLDMVMAVALSNLFGNSIHAAYKYKPYWQKEIIHILLYSFELTASSSKQLCLMLRGPHKNYQQNHVHFGLTYTNGCFCIRCRTDSLVHHGRHFSCTVHAMCNVGALINNVLACLIELENPDQVYSHELVFL